jgi:energy-coupling factor transporter ATP-binding protein EcfA2
MRIIDVALRLPDDRADLTGQRLGLCCRCRIPRWRVRLLQVNISNFRSIADQQLAAEGLVVLFGPNSAGKTSVLEAAEQLITRADIRRVDPAELVEVYADGSVFFDLPGADVPGSRDAEIYRWLLCGERSNAREWDWLGDGTSERIWHASLDQACEYLAGRLAGTGSAGTSADRVLLARSLFSPAAVFFVVLDAGVVMLARLSSLPGDAAEAASRVAAAVDEDDPLREIAAHLLAHGSARVSVLADDIEVRHSLVAAFPPVIVLDGDPDSLSAELVRSVPRIHDRLWDLRPAREPFPGIPGAWSEEPDFFLMDVDTTSGDWYLGDQWLEGLSEDGEPFVIGAFGAFAKASWYRVRHSVLAVAQMIEAEANRVAPSFVRGQGTIGIEVIPVSAWGSGPHRVRATFTEPDGNRRDLNVLGTGTARWAAAAIRLACRRLETGRQVVTSPGHAVVGDMDQARQVVRAARLSPLTQTAVRLEPSDAPGFYLADEPERHLHPFAIRSVRDWLTQLARTAATVLVATHSPILLDSPSELTTRILVLRSENGTELRPLTGGLPGELAEASDILGLTQGELLLMTRLALFVEGAHDQIILTEWFAEDLRAAGIRVFSVRGVDNLLTLVESEIIAALGIRIATLSDSTSIPRVRSGKLTSRGDRVIARLLHEAAAAGLEVKPVGLNQADILHYLDEEICQQAAPRFPGWAAAIAEHARSGTHEPWKRWVTSQYGLSLTPGTIRDLAAECRRRSKIPAEITAAIQALAAYAAETGP